MGGDEGPEVRIVSANALEQRVDGVDRRQRARAERAR
jgi:hypothetical protein